MAIPPYIDGIQGSDERVSRYSGFVIEMKRTIEGIRVGDTAGEYDEEQAEGGVQPERLLFRVAFGIL